MMDFAGLMNQANEEAKGTRVALAGALMDVAEAHDLSATTLANQVIDALPNSDLTLMETGDLVELYRMIQELMSAISSEIPDELVPNEFVMALTMISLIVAAWDATHDRPK